MRKKITALLLTCSLLVSGITAVSAADTDEQGYFTFQGVVNVSDVLVSSGGSKVFDKLFNTNRLTYMAMSKADYNSISDMSAADFKQKAIVVGQTTFNESGEYKISFRMKADTGEYVLVVFNPLSGIQAFDFSHTSYYYTEFNEAIDSQKLSDMRDFMDTYVNSLGLDGVAYSNMKSETKDALCTDILKGSAVTSNEATVTYLQGFDFAKYLFENQSAEDARKYLSQASESVGHRFNTTLIHYFLTTAPMDTQNRILEAHTGAGNWNDFENRLAFEMFSEYFATVSYYGQLDAPITAEGNPYGIKESLITRYNAAPDQKGVLKAFNANLASAQSMTDVNTALQNALQNPLSVDDGDVPAGVSGGSTWITVPSTRRDDSLVDPGVTNGFPFTDMDSSHWAYDAVETLYKKNIVTGVSDTEYDPSSNVTREQFIKLLTAALRLTGVEAEVPFEDVKESDWFYNAVGAGLRAKLINGISDTEFGTGQYITREDVAVILKRAAEYKGLELTAADDSTFNDKDSISSYAVSAVNSLSAMGILNGTDGYVNPKNPITRAEVAQLTYTFLDKLGLFVNIIDNTPESSGAVSDAVKKQSTPAEQRAEMIFKLGIASSPSDDVDRDSSTITRAEFVQMCMNLVTGNNIPQATVKLPYDDVYAGHSNYKAIAAAYEKGVIANGLNFNPDEPASGSFAANTLAYALGFAELNGYMTDWTQYFSKATLTRNVNTAKAEISLNDAYTLIYNALPVSMFTLDSVDINSNLTYTQRDDMTPLYKFWKMTKVEGRVNATALASLAGNTTGTNSIKIGSEVYTCDGGEYLDRIGRYVDAFIYDGEIFHIAEDVPKGRTNVTISADDFDDYTGKYVYYYNSSDKRQSLKLDDAVIVYNNAEISGTDFTDDIFDIAEGEITLLEGDDGYDVILINEWNSIVISYSGEDSDGNVQITSANIPGRILSYSSEDYITLKDANGKITDTSALKKDSLLTYRQSKDGKFFEGIVSTNIITANAQSVTNGKNGYAETIKIDGTSYKLTNDVKLGGINPQTGTSYTYYVTPFGNIGAVMANANTEEIKFGFIYRAAKTNAGEYMLKIIDNDASDADNAMYYEFADSVKIDGIKARGDNIFTALKRYDGTVNVACAYKVNKEGKVSYIDTPYYNLGVEEKETLRERAVADRDVTGGTIFVKGDSRYKQQFANMYIMPFNGIIISRTSDNSDAYMVSNLRGDSNYPTDKLKFYSMGEDTYIVNMAVYTDNSAQTESTSYTSGYWIVEEVNRSVLYGEDEQLTTYIRLNNSGTIKEYYFSPKTDVAAEANVAAGDLVRISLNNKNEINGMSILYAYKDAGSEASYKSAVAYNQDKRITVGRVSHIEYNASMAKYIVSYYLTDPQDIETVFIDGSAIKKLSVDRNDVASLTTCLPETIKSYDDFGTDADTIMCITTWTICSQMYIYE